MTARQLQLRDSPQAEERQAAQRLRAIEKATRARARANAQRREVVIREELATPRARECSCPITPGSTGQELRALGAGCTAGLWVCPTLDAIRRRLRA